MIIQQRLVVSQAINKEKMETISKFPCSHQPVRSISFPPRVHPVSQRVEALLNHLKPHHSQPISITTCLEAETIQSDLVVLAELYNCMEELFHSPQTKQTLLRYQDGKLVEEALRGSVTLLDACESARDLLLVLKEHMQTLHSAVRRRKGDSNIESIISAYESFKKKAKKTIAKQLGQLKRMKNKANSFSLLDQDQQLVFLARVIKEASTITISILHSLLVFMSMPTFGTKGSSLISKLKPTVLFSSLKEQKNTNGVADLNNVLCSLLRREKNGDSSGEFQRALTVLETLNNTKRVTMANKFHVRSNSFPTGSHPSSIRVEEELSKLKTWEATSTSTSKSIFTGLSLLQDLHIGLEDLLIVASTQKLISNYQGEKCIEELLDGSVRILDVCGITRDTMLQIKENVKSLHSTLRRRKRDSSIEKIIAEYNFFSKKMKKNAKKMMTSLKKMESKFGVSPLLNQDQQLVPLVRVLREVIVMNMSIFQSLLTFLAVPASKSKATKWLFVAKLMHKGVIACEEKQENCNELQCVEVSLSTLLSEGTNAAKMQAARERLETLENAIESIKNALEIVFRRMSHGFLSKSSKHPNFRDLLRIEKFCLINLYIFPTGSHPSTITVEEELSKLKTWEATSTSTSKSIGTGLSLLQDLHIDLEDLLNMASTQKLISNHQGEKCMEELLDGSVRILDICGITRDTILQTKENVQSLHSALRRRKGDSSIEKIVAEYNFFSKKMKKNAKKMISTLKQTESKFVASPLLNQDQQLVALVRVLREVIVMNMSIFQSLLTFLAAPASKSKATKWLFVAKLMHKGVIACEEKQENSNELQCVEASLSTLLSDGTNVEKMQAARERLEKLENAIESIENALEIVFRRMGVRDRLEALENAIESLENGLERMFKRQEFEGKKVVKHHNYVRDFQTNRSPKTLKKDTNERGHNFKAGKTLQQI
ncbi:hypothetical protein HKD37_11G030814 [Glycine soja]